MEQTVQSVTAVCDDGAVKKRLVIYMIKQTIITDAQNQGERDAIADMQRLQWRKYCWVGYSCTRTTITCALLTN